jgi:hypothetical protein
MSEPVRTDGRAVLATAVFGLAVAEVIGWYAYRKSVAGARP